MRYGRVVVLGGDCALTLGVVSALHRGGGDLGLLYFDGDADLSRPSSTDSGVLDAMGMAHLLGEADSPISRLLGDSVLPRDDQIAMISYDPEEPGAYDATVLARHPDLFARSTVDVGRDPAGVARCCGSTGWPRSC